MLCDDILNDTELPKLYHGFDKAQRTLRVANKYVLAPDFTAAADGLVNNFKELARIAPFCRLPAQNCWFEVAQVNRPHFMKSPMDFEDYQSRPSRVGFLCIAKPNELWNWQTVLCWSLTETKFGSGPLNASVISVHFNTKDGIEGDSDPLARYIGMGVAPFTPNYIMNMIESRDSRVMQIFASDWGGEIRYLLSVLGLFNARNVMEVEKVDKTKHNKKRIAHRKPPLCDHTLLKIRAMHRRSFLGTRGKGTAGDVREHFCSGHWKHRKTGLFWWNPFWRGNPQRGQVTHDYQVQL